jgi:uncharacterized membrane protein YbhN (UPF0104 family)
VSSEVIVETLFSEAQSFAIDFGNSVERTLVLFVFGVVLFALAGQRMEKLELEVAARPARSFALGLLSAIAIFAVAVALSVTIIGIPIAAAGALVAAFAMYAGLCAALRTIGAALVRHRTENPYLHLALGCALYLVVGSIPWLGDFATLGLILLGLGAVVSTKAAGLWPTPKHAY